MLPLHRQGMALHRPVLGPIRRILPVVVLWVSQLGVCAEPPTNAVAWQRWQKTLTSARSYANGFKDVTVSVSYAGPNGKTFRTLGFWDGGSTFKIRCAFPRPGRWTWTTTCTDTGNAGLHRRSGTVHVAPYVGKNRLYRHGFLRVSANRRHLAHADGTPFLWMGDTHWGATALLTEAGFRRWVDDRAAKRFTVLLTNIARLKRGPTDADGNRLWQDRRWNIRFMRKLDREFDYANDRGLVLFVNGLIDLKWDQKISDYRRLMKMIAARYYGHFVSYSSSMDDGFSTQHDEIAALIDAATDRHMLTQHTGTSARHPAKYYDRAYLDYSMNQSGHHGNNYERASKAAIEWHLRLYRRNPHKPVVNGEGWYEGMASPEQAAHIGYLSLLSGCFGYTYGAVGQDGDEQLNVLLRRKGATYMTHLHDFFMAVDGGRPLRPRHELIRNQRPTYREKLVLAVTESGTKHVAFLPQGGEVQIDLGHVRGKLSGRWFDPTTGRYGAALTETGGAIRSFTSPFGRRLSVLTLVRSR